MKYSDLQHDSRFAIRAKSYVCTRSRIANPLHIVLRLTQKFNRKTDVEFTNKPTILQSCRYSGFISIV
jgi:hypothetical protein